MMTQFFLKLVDAIIEVDSKAFLLDLMEIVTENDMPSFNMSTAANTEYRNRNTYQIII